MADQHWLTDSQFTSSVALAQAAPGPNVLFVALMGWNVGLNAGGGLGGGPSAGAMALLGCLFYTSEAAHERSRVELGGARVS